MRDYTLAVGRKVKIDWRMLHRPPLPFPHDKGIIVRSERDGKLWVRTIEGMFPHHEAGDTYEVPYASLELLPFEFRIIVHCRDGERIECMVDGDSKAHAISKFMARSSMQDRDIYNVHVYKEDV